MLEMSKGNFLDEEKLFEEYMLEDARYFNKVVSLTGKGETISEDIIKESEDKNREISKVMLVGDGFWLEPLLYWTNESIKGRLSRLIIYLGESRFRSKWVRKADSLSNSGVEVPEYTIPENPDPDNTHNLTDNAHFESIMQAFSILNLEWVLYVDSQLDKNIDRELVNSMIDEASHFFSTGEVRNPDLLRMQIEQHRYAADWLENFLDLIDTESYIMRRSLTGISAYLEKLFKKSIFLHQFKTL